MSIAFPQRGERPWDDDLQAFIARSINPYTGMLLPEAVEAAYMAAGGPSSTQWYAFLVSRTIAFQGVVPTVDDLPLTGNLPGFAYLVETGEIHVWSGDSWVGLGFMQGPPGQKGETGAKGPPGNDAAIYIQDGEPTTASDGDFWIDTDADTATTLQQIVEEVVAESDVVTDAAALAADAAVDAEIAGRDLAELKTVQEDEIGVTHTDEEGNRLWLEAGIDGLPTDYAVDLMSEKMSFGVDMNTGVTGLGVSFQDEEGNRLWIETDEFGEPTEYAVSLIRAKLGGLLPDGGTHGQIVIKQGSEPYEAVWGDAPSGSGGGGGGILPIAPSTAWGSGHGHPRATKPLAAAILSIGDQDAESLYWPMLADLRPSGGDGVALLYSTDHAVDHADSGIYLATAPSPLGPFTPQGLAFRDDLGGSQCETPAPIWVEDEGVYYVYYQMSGVGTGSQSTLLAKSVDLTPGSFEKYGIVIQMVDTSEPGNGHTGYCRPFRRAGSWYTWSLYGDSSRRCLWQSGDGIDWVANPMKMGHGKPNFSHLPGADRDWLVKWGSGDVVEWRGQMWWIGSIGPRESGGTVEESLHVAGPLTADLMGFASRPVDITPPAQSWEGTNGITGAGNLLVWDDRLFQCYRVGNGTTEPFAFGVMEII
jgi:hypothetical protein